MSKARKHLQQGYILLSVVGMLAICAAMASLILLSARQTAISTRTELDLVRLDSAMQAGISRSVFLLDAEQYQLADGRVRSFRYADIEVQVRLTDTRGLVALNAVDPAFLEIFLERFASENADPARLAAAIMDWRDPDDEPLPLGAEQRDYTGTGMAGPGNRNFVHKIELANVMGMDPTSLQRILPLVSVYATSSQPVPEYAPLSLLDILDIDSAKKERILQAREEGLALVALSADPGFGPAQDQNDEQPDEVSGNIVILQALVLARTASGVKSGAQSGVKRAETARVHFHTQSGKVSLYARQVIDYFEAKQHLPPEPR